jgi:hypothetical protein
MLLNSPTISSSAPTCARTKKTSPYGRLSVRQSDNVELSEIEGHVEFIIPLTCSSLIFPTVFLFLFFSGKGRGESGWTLRSLGILTLSLAGSREKLVLKA